MCQKMFFSVKEYFVFFWNIVRCFEFLKKYRGDIIDGHGMLYFLTVGSYLKQMDINRLRCEEH